MEEREASNSEVANAERLMLTAFRKKRDCGCFKTASATSNPRT